MRILIIGAPHEFARECASLVASHWPGAGVDGPDQTLPTSDEEWTRYDAVLVDHRPGGHSGMSWLRECGPRLPQLPPAILLSVDDGMETAVRAIKLGAADCLPARRLTPHRLVGAINDAILERARNRDRVLARARLKRRYEHSVTIVPDVTAIGNPAPADAPEINGYRMLRQIGEGGTSRVYLAERLPRLGHAAPEPRQVVLKVVDARAIRDPAFIERFIREYRIISTVQNEHVARIHDQGVTDDHLYIAMEYFPRGDLRQRMEQAGPGRMHSLLALKISAQIARALDAIHTAGVIHRDLKPHNIMFRDNDRLALVDFGLAKQVGEKTITASAGLAATPLYMSPEQCVGQPQDARSDLYSLGVILYEMLTGERLFDGDSLAAIAFRHVHADIPRLPPPLDGYQTVIDRLLAKNPADRYVSARELFTHIAH